MVYNKNSKSSRWEEGGNRVLEVGVWLRGVGAGSAGFLEGAEAIISRPELLLLHDWPSTLTSPTAPSHALLGPAACR